MDDYNNQTAELTAADAEAIQTAAELIAALMED